MPLDADLRPFARTVGQLTAVGAVVSGLALVAGVQSPYFAGLLAGVFLTSVVVALSQFQSIRFKTQHLNEGLDFWRDHWGRVRPRAYTASVVGIALGAALLVAGVLLARPWLIGFPEAPLLAFIVVVNTLHGRLTPR